ncbi:MAG: M20/M25/M40 family metallo-hydrolase [Kofleriaceae bacterium]|nr:M20/M25/M40 family metallo-hydrolase [Kofleriaceae bacterium]
MSSLDRCVERLIELVGYDTVNPTGDELALCKVLASSLRKLGADSVEITEVPRTKTTPGKTPGAYVYAKFGTPTLLLNVHLDTVPANSGWQRDPFVAQVTEDRFYGLGSCDIKGAIAAILVALESGKAENLGVLFSGDEEAGSQCMPHFLANTDLSEVKTAIVCEPTARAAGIKHRGMQSYRASYIGKGGHSSKADTMEKPIVELAKLALQLDAIAVDRVDRGPEGMKGLCMNVAKLDGGVAYNVVPDMAELSFSVRPPPGFDRAEFAVLLEHARLSSHEKIVLVSQTDHKPFACGNEDKLRELVSPYASDFVSLDFWTEAALLQEAGIDAVVIGPGDIAQAHTADEFVSLADLAWATAMFEDVIARHAT